MKRLARRFWSNDEGAIAPTLALSLFALIAAGGIAFDYSRMAALDTELQNAADQAALAAAGQLDQSAGSRDRATAAAQDLVENLTLFANDGGGTGIDIPTVEFFSTYNAARANLNDSPGTTATTDETANYVRVTVETRAANFALTPIVAALTSGPLSARALAGLGAATCNLPPVMICNPFEGISTNDFASSRGYGVELVNQGGGGGWAPGNFAYLDDPNTDNGTPGVRAALGWNSIPGGCSAGPGVDTETGLASTVTDALNTRFDIQSTNGCPTGGTCSPSTNVVKDIIRSSNANLTQGCRIGPQGWKLSSNYYGLNLPTSTALLTNAEADTITSMGHPRDICHSLATPSCGQVGDGAWDRNAYFRVNHPSLATTWQTELTNAGLSPSTVTRYEVYLWELNGHMPNPDPRTVTGTDQANASPICASGLAPGGANPDRRRMSAALVNCVAQGVTGSSPGVRPYGWVDLFLVEPSLNRARTNAGEIYVEVIGPSDNDGEGTGEVVSRNVPRLLE